MKNTYMKYTYANAWIPLIGLVLMALLIWILLDLIVNQAIEDASIYESVAIVTWSLSVLLFALTAFSLFSNIVNVIFERRNSNMEFILLITLILLMLGIIMILFKNTDFLEFNKILIHQPIYNNFPNVEYAVLAVSGIGILALASLAIAVLLILSTAKIKNEIRSSNETLTSRTANLAKDQKTIRTLLYSGAFVLVAGTLEAIALYSWSKTKIDISSSSFIADMGSFPIIFSTLNGIFYSILLAVIFVPALHTVSKFADQLATEAIPNASEQDRNKWLENHEIYNSVPKMLLSSLAVVSPVLVGPLSFLLNMIIP